MEHTLLQVRGPGQLANGHAADVHPNNPFEIEIYKLYNWKIRMPK